jgi:hypothetical protein
MMIAARTLTQRMNLPDFPFSPISITDYRLLITDHRLAIGFPPSSYRVIA